MFSMYIEYRNMSFFFGMVAYLELESADMNKMKTNQIILIHGTCRNFRPHFSPIGSSRAYFATRLP